MATETSPSSEVSVTRLLTGILNDAQDLAFRHFQLFRSEVMDSLRETRNALVMLGVGIMLVQLGIYFLCQMVVVLLTRFFPTLTLWGSYAIVGGALAFCGAWPLMTAVRRLSSLDPSSSEPKDGERKINHG